MAGTRDLEQRPAELNGSGLRVAVLAARFNEHINQRLLDGALREFDTLGVRLDDITVEWVPGAIELPLAAKIAAASGRHDAVLCLGCVIRGETDHYRYVCESAAHGMMQAGLQTGVPILFGVLTVDHEHQALARAGDDSTNKGCEGARAAIEMIHTLRRLGSD